MAKFQFKHRTLRIRNASPRVFFTCHPADFDNCFEKICEDIFRRFRAFNAQKLGGKTGFAIVGLARFAVGRKKQNAMNVDPLRYMKKLIGRILVIMSENQGVDFGNMSVGKVVLQ